MPHIHTEPGQHDHTASAYIIRTDGEEPRLLLHRHKLLDVYMQIGGHVELDETPWQAVIHEVAEESGYLIGQLKILQPHIRLKSMTGAIIHPQPACVITHPFKDKEHYHTDTGYAFVTTEDPAQAVADGESGQLRLFSSSELAKLDDDQIIENVREIGQYILRECLKSWEAVPTNEFK